MIYRYIYYIKHIQKINHSRDVLFVTTFETFLFWVFYMKRKQNVHYLICKDAFFNRKGRNLERKKGIVYLQCVKVLHLVISEFLFERHLQRKSIIFINNVLFVHLDGHNDACFRDYIRKIGYGTKASSTYVQWQRIQTGYARDTYTVRGNRNQGSANFIHGVTT